MVRSETTYANRTPLSTMNDEITKATSDHKRRQWREFVECIDHRTDSTKLWWTIKGIDGKSKQTEENQGITFIGTSPKLGKHSSSRRTRQMSIQVQSRAVGLAEHTA